MQQHLMQMQPMMASYYPNNVTTDHIQQYLDENKSLILKIVEGQNTGKLNDCAENQAKLQRNLMYLAAIADSQPQPPPMHSQYPSSGMMQPGASHYMQQQQQQASQAMTPQSLMAARSSMMYSQQQQQQPFSSLQQQALHSQLVMSAGGSSGLHMLQNEASNAGGSAQLGAGYDYGRSSPVEGMHRRMGKQDMGSGSSGGHGSDGSESLYLKSSDDGN